MEEFKSLVKKSRSVRRFDESHSVPRETLEELVDLARYAPSAANRQPLKYFLSCSPGTNEKIFPALGWAAYLTEWPGPAEGQRPSAYIIILADKTISETVIWDHSICAQTILLGAAAAGLGGCIIGALNRPMLKADLQLDDRYEIMLVLAIGKPDEIILIEEIEPDTDIKYYRTPDGTHRVPKRRLGDIIIN
jgi:nitroreductase